ncbi:MAG TPA: YdeI/OmpD-associated family protein [Gemmatimonadales bacterium]|nr:YdeI/OmpD-associated family protein [Gemmatimonadales bacterium]
MMGTRDARIDAYIEKSAEFARPILRHIRETVHAASPDIDETIKWGFPHFTHQGIVCSMAAFKEHCAFGFWKGPLLVKEGHASEEAMGQFGRIRTLRDLPPKKVIIGYVREAIRLNQEGVKVPALATRKRKEEIEAPPEFTRALRKQPGAVKAFEKMPPSHRREYIEWITEAKRAETRDRRIATAVEWISEGKSRNWKYEKRWGRGIAPPVTTISSITDGRGSAPPLHQGDRLSARFQRVHRHHQQVAGAAPCQQAAGTVGFVGGILDIIILRT